ncbi:50S ribosomal protein L15 [Candidatus Bathyarchaeota archaeon]|nr:uL15 family ribosomal protein [Candidatus Bathyarchaeota archaeon]RJS69707.1 MAG: 50S ribosomal protein L15 [Candidatus Bathyarchaeota archaeon]RLI22103.1 MAG: 50S ribosomal protein L15 [Candidatus Bathyarchaeota archaeon]
MPHKLRKTRKKRGSRTVGYGRVGQHRKSGSKGMRKAGRHKQGWSYVIKYEPEYFGKRGFTSPKSLRRRVNIINVGTLDEIAEEVSTEKKKDKLFIDLENLGYTKLLGKGKVTKPLIIKVSSYSKSAAEKIKEAGGRILTELEKSK